MNPHAAKKSEWLEPADVSALSLAAESDIVSKLAAAAESFEKMYPAARARAEGLVTHIRTNTSKSGIEAFLKEYGLGTREGIVIMCLAEALLRIPDSATQDALIRDRLGEGAWKKHLGKSDSLFVNASTWGLMLTGKVVELGDLKEGLKGIFGGLVAKVGEPVIRESLKTAMRIIGTQFVTGEDIESALKKSKDWLKQGYRYSYDILGEGARSKAQAAHYYEAYMHALDAIAKSAEGTREIFARPGMSVKLSGLYPRYEMGKEALVRKELLPMVEAIFAKARDLNIAVSLDAEESYRFDMALGLYEELIAMPAFKGWEGMGFVLQAYQKRALAAVARLSAAARARGARIPVRLVKGAYWDAEIKRAQVMGLSDYPVFTRKEHTDVSYLACAAQLLHENFIYPQFATHNALTVASILEAGKGRKFEFQRLHGMGEALYEPVIGDVPCRIYAPVGKHENLLAYLIRRLLENGANTSFVHLLVEHDRPMDELLADPIAKSQNFTPNPKIPLPENLYGAARRNSEGVDFGNLSDWTAFSSSLERYKGWQWHIEGERKQVTNPADTGDIVGSVPVIAEKDAEQAVTQAAEAFDAWNDVPAVQRAQLLEKTAELFEAHRHELCALLVREAGKTLADAVSEVREAVDFCRFYAMDAVELFKPFRCPGPTGESNEVTVHGRGVFACISPWNFPLAIFTGQVAAALVTGNTVIAKPAEQTPLIAKRAIELMHQAGIPKEALHYLPGKGSVVGDKLTKDPRIAGVVFTGSTQTAWHINRALASRDAPIATFIAETGGQNGMIVDSTALPEQTVDDILLSAFGSAGQRCSALRVLCLQEDVADTVLELMKGAMAEIQLGNPWDISTDIGPVIDAKSKAELLAHIDRMRREARLIAGLEVPGRLAGHYVGPHVFELKSLKQLTGEVFGPVLHVLRYKEDKLDAMIDEINATGFGLTFGIQSRIEEKTEYLRSRIRAGNVYVNRSMIGAVVGVQPFGGEGLSGTGPKAGGYHYLKRFILERTFTVNTAAIGGNLELLA